MSEAESTSGVHLKQLMPSLTVGDIAASLAFYEGVLGCHVVERYEDDGRLVAASVAAGEVSFMLGQDDWKQGKDRQKGLGLRFYCVTDQDVDELASAIKGRGGELAQEPTDQPWGSRDFAIVDPDGFKISISTQPSS